MRAMLLLLLAAPAVAAPPVGENGLLADLARFPLGTESFSMVDGLLEELPDDPGTIDFLTTVLECALPFETQLVVGEGDRAVTFNGYWGLAPEWAEGPCEEACQEWVSACLLARTNAYGLPVSIYVDGDNPTLRALVTPDRQGFTVREAAYYGNVFNRPARSFACRGDGRDPLALTWRVCARPGARCGFEDVGPCGPIDGETGAPAAQSACTVAADGTYENCRDRLDPGGRVYTHVLTLFMKPTSFGGALAESCGEPPTSTPAPPMAGAIGTPCVNDTACGEGLYCDTTYVGQGLCTRVCGEGDAEDDAICGDPAATCLRSASKNFCTPACTAGEAGTCAPGQLCTGLWLQLSDPDDPGCLPFCATDDQCGTGTFCNPRFGTCGPPLNPEGREDGEPCDPTGARFEVGCRGLCFRVDDDPTHGLCASLINMGVQDDCPDRPRTMSPLRPNNRDDLAVCLYRGCTTDDNCGAPLKCVSRPLQPKQCLYPPP